MRRPIRRLARLRGLTYGHGKQPVSALLILRAVHLAAASLEAFLNILPGISNYLEASERAICHGATSFFTSLLPSGSESEPDDLAPNLAPLYVAETQWVFCVDLKRLDQGFLEQFDECQRRVDIARFRPHRRMDFIDRILKGDHDFQLLGQCDPCHLVGIERNHVIRRRTLLLRRRGGHEQ